MQIVAPRPGVRIGALTVTPDGDFVDYVAIEQSPQVAYTLWRVPFLGGAPRTLIDGVHSGVGWSPDGRQLAFVRMHGRLGEEGIDLVIADAKAETNVCWRHGVIRTPPFSHRQYGRVSHARRWSPDGAVITSSSVGFPGRVLTGYTMFTTVADGRCRRSCDSTGQMAWIDTPPCCLPERQVGGSRRQLSRLRPPSGAGRVSRTTSTAILFEPHREGESLRR